jgi:chromosome segregation ATPase
MSEEREEEGPTTIEEMNTQSEEREEEGPTTIDMTDKQISIQEAPIIVPQEEKLQEQNKEIEQVQEESKISKSKQKRRITSYLSNISKQVEKHGNQINKISMMVISLQKQRQTKSTTDVGRINQSQSQSIKQIQSQLNQLQKQVTRIQKDLQRIRAATTKRTKAKIRKPSSATAANVKPRSKKSKSLKSTKARKGRRSIK